MTKFKVGDVVTPAYVDEGMHSWLIKGNKYIVESYYEEGFVDVSGEFNGMGHCTLGWDVGWFTLATPSEQFTETAESLKALIFSLRKEREQTLSKLKGLDTQEVEAISQLNALGFSLFEEGKVNSSPSKTVLYVEDIEEDMTDPENWKVGDMIQCVDGKGWERWIGEGEVAEMVEPLSPMLHLKTKYGLQWFGSMHYQDFKFHSRPLK